MNYILADGPWCFFLCLFAIGTAEALSPPTQKHAVVVGGGPVGLATALTLSNPPHCYNVTVLEQASVEQYDPTKAYLYNVNQRGQLWMKENFPGALAKLQERGSVGSMARITIVPADPKLPIPERKTLAQYDTTKNNPQDKKEGEEIVDDPQLDKRNYWVPRHSMICLLEDEINEQQAKGDATMGCIELKKGRKFINLEPLDDGSLQVCCQDLESGTTENYCGSLIVAADGFKSAVSRLLFVFFVHVLYTTNFDFLSHFAFNVLLPKTKQGP